MNDTIEGAVAKTPGAAQTLLQSAEAELRTLHAVGKTGRAFLSHYGIKVDGPKLIDATKVLRRCAALENHFNVVTRDDSITRQVKASDGRVVSVPLVFAQKYPFRSLYVFELEPETTTGVIDPWNPYRQQEKMKVSAQTPVPTLEVMRAIKQHKERFDHLELWWVPNDILVTPLPKPDPILVGYVGVPGWKGFYFEIHRWVDETVETAYWAKEGY